MLCVVFFYILLGLLVRLISHSFISVKCMRVTSVIMHKKRGRTRREAFFARNISEIILWPGILCLMLHECWCAVKMWRIASRMLRKHRRRIRKLHPTIQPNCYELVNRMEEDLRYSLYRELHEMYM